MQDTKKWFDQWNALHLLSDASIEPMANKAFLQCECIAKWYDEGVLDIPITLPTLPLPIRAPFSQRNVLVARNIYDRIVPILVIHIVVSMHLSSHSFQCESG